MNSYGYGQQPAGQGWRRYSWLIILAVGIGLGALLVGPLGGQLRFTAGRDDRAGMVQRSEQQRQATAPDTTRQQTAPRQAGRDSDTAQQPRAGDARGRRHDGFLPFGQLGLTVPLLLMGAGAWLIWGRGRGPWQGGGAGPARPTAPFESMTPSDQHSETGETRRL